MNRFLSICFALIASCLPVLAQTGTPIKQSGNVTPTHAWCVTTNGTAQDCGTAAIPFLTSIGAVYNGPSICAWSALSTSGAAQQICLGATNSGGATITVQNFGTASALPLSLSLNGVIYQFPFSTSGVIGPVTTIINDGACWGNTTGTLLKECAPLVLLNGFSNGVQWKNVSGTPDAAMWETTGGTVGVQTGQSGTYDVTDQQQNPIFQAEGPVPQAQGGTTNGNNFTFQSNICSVGDEDFTITGSPTTGEQPGFSYKVGSTTVTITYTVLVSDTNNTIAIALANLVKNSLAMAGIINGTCPNGNYYNGTATSVNFGGGESGFDIIYTADPNLSGNAWTAINTTHTTVTLLPVSTFIGQASLATASFISGRNAVANDVVYVETHVFQDSTGAAANYLTDILSVLSPTAGAATMQRQWVSGGCGFYWYVVATTASYFAADPCDLNIGANAAPTNNVTVYTGSAGTLILNPGSGGVSISGAKPLIFHNATSGSISLQAPTGALGTQTLTLPDATDTLMGKATTDTLTNKTIASTTDTLGGVTMGLGSDATGDIYYRNSGGQLARLPIGSTNQQLTVSGGLPSWQPNSGAMANLCTITASNSASLTNISNCAGLGAGGGFTSTYTSYLLVFQKIVPATNEKILELQIHSGGAFKTTGYLSQQTVNVTVSAAVTTYIPLTFPGDAQGASLANATPGFSGWVIFNNPSVSDLIMVSGQGSYLQGSGTPAYSQSTGYWNTGGVVDGFQVLMDSGNITSGTIIIYGIL